MMRSEGAKETKWTPMIPSGHYMNVIYGSKSYKTTQMLLITNETSVSVAYYLSQKPHNWTKNYIDAEDSGIEKMFGSSTTHVHSKVLCF